MRLRQVTGKVLNVKGIGNIPYILVTQKQFNYIMALPYEQFDSPSDIAYQQANFVNIPKVVKATPTEVRLIPNPNRVEDIQTSLEKEETGFIEVHESFDDEDTGETENTAQNESIEQSNDTQTEQTSVEVKAGIEAETAILLTRQVL